MIRNTDGSLHKCSAFVGIIVSSLAIALVTACYVYSANAYGIEAEVPYESQEERALLENGAREIMDLDEGEVDEVLKDPEARSYIPVKVESFSREIKPSTSSAVGSRSTNEVAAECEGEKKDKVYTVQLTDIEDRVMLKFIVTKVWCFKNGVVTYGKTGPAETWVRPDLRYNEEDGGWKYSPTSEFGVERFLSYQGKARAAHESSRSGGFKLYRRGGEDVLGASVIGVNQIGFYHGGCNSSDFTPAIPKFLSGPSGTVASREANLRFDAGDGATYQCDLDGKGFEKCTSPEKLYSLRQGDHVFKVRAIEANGNASVISKREWTVDAGLPIVSSVTPADGATGVSKVKPIRATFSKDMDELSFYGGNFTLVESDGGVAVDGAIFYDSSSKTATFDPFEDLKPGISYTARIKGGDSGVTDTTGLTMSQAKTWSFTVTESQ